MKKKQALSAKRHQFLLDTFFPDTPDEYATKEVGNYILVKQWNGGSSRWEVAIWDKDKYYTTKEMFSSGMFK